MTSAVKLHHAVSENTDLVAAAREAVAALEGKAQHPKLVLFFCTFNYDPSTYTEAVAVLEGRFGSAPVVGGSCLGFFDGEHCYDAFSNQAKTRGAGVFVLDGADLEVGVGLGTGVDEDPKAAGRAAALNALEGLHANLPQTYAEVLRGSLRDVLKYRPVNAILLTPGWTDKHLWVEGDILAGICSITGSHLRLTGGGMSGGLNANGTWDATYSFFCGKVHREAAVIILFSTPAKVGYGVGNGYTAGNAGVFVTKIDSDGRTAVEIDGKPAASVVSDMFQRHGGIKPDEFNANPLVATLAEWNLGVSEGYDGFYWPALPAKIDGGKVVFVSKISEGIGLSMVRLSKLTCMASAHDAAQQAREDSGASSFDLALFFTCGMRGLFLAREYSSEMASVRSALGQNVPMFGMVSCAEVASYRGGVPRGTGFSFSLLGIGK